MRSLCIGLLSFFALCSAFCSAEERATVSFQPDWFVNGQFAGFFSALDEGIYEKHGLDVEIGEFAFGSSFLEKVAC